MQNRNYYIFFNIEEFWDKVNYYKSKNILWLCDEHVDYNPNIVQEDMPCVLSVDDSMIYGIISTNKKTYFSNLTFMKIYNTKLREIKLKRILNEKNSGVQ